MYSVFRRSKTSHRAVNTDWIATKNSVWAHDTQTTCSRWIEEASVSLVHTSFDGDYYNQGKDDYSDMIVH